MKKISGIFQCKRNNKKVAQMIAEEVKADYLRLSRKFHIQRLILTGWIKKSRSSVEMSDKKYRPAIMKKEMDMSSYDEILLGFPKMEYSL